MNTERGVSQILFGFLPGQTVDLAGGVWLVEEWYKPMPLQVDVEALRAALLREVASWATAGRDGGLVAALQGRRPLEVVRPDPSRGGVRVRPFPHLWRCKSCERILRDPARPCRCGAGGRPAQLHFVAYHHCGALEEPIIPRCDAHGEVAMRLPGTTRLSEIEFYCPICTRTLRRGFYRPPCRCRDGVVDVSVHRSASVFTPHYVVLVNPPDPAEASRFRRSGGATRALEWLLGGLRERDPSQGPQTAEGLAAELRRLGVPEAIARETVRMMREEGRVVESQAIPAGIPAGIREEAEEEAFAVWSATRGGFITVPELLATGDGDAATETYRDGYPEALRRAGLQDVWLLTDFPVAVVAYGYTRDQWGSPDKARLVPFRSRAGLRLYGNLYRTEALLFLLDPLRVYEWLARKGLLPASDVQDQRSARLAILERAHIPGPREAHGDALGTQLATLVHSYAHRVIRRLSPLAGIDREALAEYLLPHSLAFIVYAASRSEFVLGGIQAVFETSLHLLLDDVVLGESRCPLDPGCRSGGGACMACLHLGEPACRWGNRHLDRSVLFGADGFFARTIGATPSACMV